MLCEICILDWWVDADGTTASHLSDNETIALAIFHASALWNSFNALPTTVPSTWEFCERFSHPPCSPMLGLSDASFNVCWCQGGMIRWLPFLSLHKALGEKPSAGRSGESCGNSPVGPVLRSSSVNEFLTCFSNFRFHWSSSVRS